MTTPEQNAAFEELMAQKSGDPVTTAFLVVQTPEGQWQAHADYSGMDIILDRSATLDDIIGGCAAVQAGATSQQTAFHTVVQMQQHAAVMQRKLQEQQEAAKISQLLDTSKLRSPLA